MSVISMRDLLEAGVHFGHRTRRWNPKMRPYIFTERSGIHIIDLHQTMLQIEAAYERLRTITARGGTVLFVGTKRQAQAAIQAEAERARSPYINLRWLGGTLTNWTTIKARINYLLQLERRWDAGEFVNLNKKEQLTISREIEKLNRRLGGLKVMNKLPDAIFIVDTHAEELAVKEAVKLKIPIYGMVDTNSDPDQISHVIPCNDDAIRSVKLIVSVIANSVEEGMRVREIDMADSGQVSETDRVENEQYLGPNILAKLKDNEAAEIPAEADATPNNGAPKETVSTETESAETASVETTSAETTPTEEAPTNAISEEVISEEVVSEEAVAETTTGNGAQESVSPASE